MPHLQRNEVSTRLVIAGVSGHLMDELRMDGLDAAENKPQPDSKTVSI